MHKQKTVSVFCSILCLLFEGTDLLFDQVSLNTLENALVFQINDAQAQHKKKNKAQTLKEEQAPFNTPQKGFFDLSDQRAVSYAQIIREKVCMVLKGVPLHGSVVVFIKCTHFQQRIVSGASDHFHHLMSHDTRAKCRGVARIFQREFTLCQSEGTHQIVTMAKVS